MVESEDERRGFVGGQVDGVLTFVNGRIVVGVMGKTCELVILCSGCSTFLVCGEISLQPCNIEKIMIFF